MLIDQKTANALSTNNLIYLFRFYTDNFNLCITDQEHNITVNDTTYISGVEINNIALNNLTDIEHINIKMLNNINDAIVPIEVLLRSKVEIQMLFQNEEAQLHYYHVFSGYISSIEVDNNLLNITLTPLLTQLNQTIGDVFSPICRACFGSDQCGINLEQYKTSGKIIRIISSDCIIGTHQTQKSTSTGYYRYGLLKFITGKLAGICVQIKDERDGQIFLLKNTNLITIGDEYNIYAGCDKSLQMCKNKFKNIINFRGEPFIN